MKLLVFMTGFSSSQPRRSTNAICSMLCLLGFIAVLGCNGTSATSNDADRARLKVVGILYGMQMSEQGGKAPKDGAEFKAFVERDPANWNKLAGSADELLTSPRGGQPLTFVYGNDVEASAAGGMPWIAYESTPVDGQRLIVDCRGAVELISEEALPQYVPALGK